MNWLQLNGLSLRMADNTELDAGSGGDTIRTEDRTTFKTPVSLLDVGGTSAELLVTDGSQGMPTEGVAAENAAVAGNPVLTGGRYDSSARTLGDGDVGAFAMDADGAVHVSDGGNSLTIDASSLPLPSGASTAAKQPALGTAGTASSDVITVQGIASMTALTVDGSGVTQPVSASSLPLPSGAASAANQSTANGLLMAIDADTSALAGCVGGTELQVDIVSSASLTVDLGANNDVVQSTHDNFNANVNVQQGDTDVGSGNPLEVTLANGSVPSHAVTNAGTFAVQSTLQAGTALVGQVAPAASTAAAGTSTFYDNDLDETKQEVTDNATVRIYSIQAFNTTDAPLFLQLFDLDADNVTVGTTTPTNQYVIPGNADADGAGFVITFPVPKAYSTGFTVACTTDSGGSSAPGAGACIVNIEYVSAA